jgi:hypothetical protein
MKELLHSFEYKGIWRRLHFEVSDEGARCRGIFLHNLLQSLLKAPSVDGLREEKLFPAGAC